ncbi:MAG: hypothetical protein H8E38_05000 [SAR324 cluster bacterium]|nr:hypothetical protein [SAR324 cluster bacterium]MBL7035019.1 hypothetical protein [SAR324 cluster bacterium]
MSEHSASQESSTTATVQIALIGMSGSGKSHWSAKLRKQGFYSFSCDDLIEKKLKEDLELQNGKKISMAEWMGLPYEPQYADAEQRYLKYEVEMLEYICNNLSAEKYNNQNVVVDTTGSLIYTGDELISCLKKKTTLVYLKAASGAIDAMYKSFLQNPRPVLWHGHYDKKSGESDKEALLRCYPQLLKCRQREYERFADVVIDIETLRKSGFGVKEFIEKIQSWH